MIVERLKNIGVKKTVGLFSMFALLLLIPMLLGNPGAGLIAFLLGIYLVIGFVWIRECRKRAREITKEENREMIQQYIKERYEGDTEI